MISIKYEEKIRTKKVVTGPGCPAQSTWRSQLEPEVLTAGQGCHHSNIPQEQSKPANYDSNKLKKGIRLNYIFQIILGHLNLSGA